MVSRTSSAKKVVVLVCAEPLFALLPGAGCASLSNSFWLLADAVVSSLFPWLSVSLMLSQLFVCLHSDDFSDLVQLKTNF